MTWISDHFLQIMSVWAALNVLLAPVANALPPTNWASKLLHVLMAIGPLDVLKAVKAIGAAAVPPTLPPAAVLLLCLGLSHCGGPQTTTAVLDTTATQVAVAAYGSEQLMCVAYAGTRQQADMCRAQVHGYWCGHGLPAACEAGAALADAGASK